jgi:1-acyl-sn-glycerol-3-phosphate acyltransferase
MSDWLAGLVRALTGVQALWRGVEPDARQRIYFANHSSHLDALVLWSALPPSLRSRARPVAARDYWGRGALRTRAAQHFRAVLIDRTGDQPHEDPLQPLEDALAAGDSLIIFPEGTRSHDGKIRPFKAGLFHLAKRHPDVQLVPVYLENLNRILPKGSMLLVPLTGAVVLGAAVAPTEGEAKADFLARAREAVLALGCS